MQRLLHTTDLEDIIGGISALGRMGITFAGVSNMHLNEICATTDALLVAYNELMDTLKQRASVSRIAYQVSWGFLHELFREYRDMDKIRGALGCACKNAVLCKTLHPPFPTIIFNCVRVRPRIFPRVLLNEPGSSLEQSLAFCGNASSTLWYELRSSLHKQVAVRSFGENWDWNSSIPLHSAFPGGSGACRVLHVAASIIRFPLLTWRINGERQFVWTTDDGDDEDNWTDCSSLASLDDVETLDTSNC